MCRVLHQGGHPAFVNEKTDTFFIDTCPNILAQTIDFISCARVHRDLKFLQKVMFVDSKKVCKYAGMQSCSHAVMQVCKYASMQVCKCASMQVYRYTGMQVCRYAGVQVYKYASLQVCKYMILRMKMIQKGRQP